MKIAKLYYRYEEFPWKLGYAMYEELDNIMVFIANEVGKVKEERRKEAKENESSQDKAKKDFNKLKNDLKMDNVKTFGS